MAGNTPSRFCPGSTPGGKCVFDATSWACLCPRDQDGEFFPGATVLSAAAAGVKVFRAEGRGARLTLTPPPLDLSMTDRRREEEAETFCRCQLALLGVLVPAVGRREEQEVLGWTEAPFLDLPEFDRSREEREALRRTQEAFSDLPSGPARRREAREALLIPVQVAARGLGRLSTNEFEAVQEEYGLNEFQRQACRTIRARYQWRVSRGCF